MAKKMNEKYLEGKLEKEIKNIKLPSKKAKDLNGVSYGSNKKMEEYYWFIPNINMVKLFNDYMKKNYKGISEGVSEALLEAYKLTSNNTICNESRCSECSKYCYCESARFYQNNISSRFNRLLEYLTRKEDLKKKILFDLEDGSVCRIHTEGDFFDIDYLQWWMDIAKESKGTKFYTYSKQWELIREYLRNKKGLPSNFYLQISLDKNTDWKDIPFDLLKHKRVNVYYVLDTTQESRERLDKLEEVLRFKVQKCKGKCKNCRQCYKSSNKITVVDIH